MNCICTGITLIDPEGQMFAADLYRRGEDFVVNANIEPHGAEFKRNKTIELTGDYWMRKGVYIVPIKDARLSLEAIHYISGGV